MYYRGIHNLKERGGCHKIKDMDFFPCPLFLECGGWDLNPHEIAPTRSLVLLVCQFRHLRIWMSLFNNRRLYYHNINIIATKKFIFLQEFCNSFSAFLKRTGLFITQPVLYISVHTYLSQYTLSAYSYATFDFASSASVANPSASVTAMSARTFLLSSTPAIFRPCIIWL